MTTQGTPRPPEPARFADAAALVRRGFAHFRVPPRISVAEYAERRLKLENVGGGYSGPFDFALAPYMRRPMECLSPGSPYHRVAVMGGSQIGKSTVGDAFFGHTVEIDPADMLCVYADKAAAHDYSVQTIDKLVRVNPALRQAQAASRGADNIHLKQFKGCNVFFGWPVASQFRQRPFPRVRLDDLDAMPENVDGEGDPVGLAESRQQTFGGFAKTYVNSSPSRGATKGIERQVTAGTDERWHVPCKECGEFFALELERCLKFDRTLEIEDAARSAHVACPHCGGVHEQGDKPALMARGLWAGPLQRIARDGTVTGALRAGTIASFRFDGLMGFAAWAQLARDWRQAELALDLAQDEEPLKTFLNTRAGANYRSRLDGVEPVEAAALVQRAARGTFRLREVPPWALCLTGSVDVQGNRFECLVRAWAPGFESAIVDRFALIAVPVTGEPLMPGLRPEHWRVLFEGVFWRRYPVQGSETLSLPLLNVAIDTGGVDGVTDNAFEFWHAAVRAGVPPQSITLIKGGNNPAARLLPAPTIDAKRQIKGQPEAGLYVPNVTALKDTLALRLRRAEPGPGYVHLPRDLQRKWAEELTAEEKVDGLWRRKGLAANETLDLMVYADVALIRHGDRDSSLAWVRERAAWAMPSATPANVRPEPSLALVPAAPPPAGADPAPATKLPPAPRVPAPPRRRILSSGVI